MAFIDKRQMWILAVTSMTTALIYLENSVLPVALPTIARHFDLTDLSSMWVVNIYLLTMAVLFLVGGRLSDLFGRKRCYLVGLFFFGLGSILASMSIGRFSLFSARLVQGIGGALAIPTISTLIVANFPVEKRGRAVGFNSGISSFFLLIGPVVGGLITTYLGWRAIFWVNIPIIVFAFIVSLFILPPDEKGEGRFHFRGAIPIVLTLFCLIFALMQGPFWGWDSWKILALFSLAVLFFIFHLIFPPHEEHPLFDMDLLKIRAYSGAILSIYLGQMATIVYIFLPLFFEDAKGFSTLYTGVLMLGVTIPYLFMAPLGGYLSDRYTSRLPVSFGFLFMTVGFLLIYFFEMAALWKVILSLFILGCGSPWIFSPSNATAMTSVPKEKLGNASSLSSTFRQVAATLSLAVMTALYHSVHLASGSYFKAFSVLLLMGAVIAAFGLIQVQFLLGSEKSSDRHF